ncbi:MAG: ribosome maturation factor RimM [Proteobacteria bacterium]|nr:ribosome maturation factor RimM [Pseudomonadota bacterium]
MGYVPVGRVISTHGIKGEVKFQYYNDEKEVFYEYTSFLVKNENNRWVTFEPTDKRLYKGFFYLKFKGFDSPEAALSLINKEFFVKEEQLPPLNDDEYYEYQLIGLKVINQDDIGMGTVTEVMHTGAQYLIVVRGEKEILIPMVEDYILSIDIINKTMTVVEPET